jgi:hypothetical protein
MHLAETSVFKKKENAAMALARSDPVRWIEGSNGKLEDQL